MNFTADNQVTGGFGGHAGAGGDAIGGHGGNGTHGGTGGSAIAATGGNGGNGGIGEGGAIETGGTLTIKPRFGAKTGSAQTKATSVITTNRAFGGAGGGPGNPGTATGGTGGSPDGGTGHVLARAAGAAGSAGEGFGGGIVIFGTTTIDDTTITGNFAATHDNDVSGVFNK